MGDAGAFFMVLTPGEAADFLRGVATRIPLEETSSGAASRACPRNVSISSKRHVELLCTELRPVWSRDVGP